MSILSGHISANAILDGTKTSLTVILRLLVKHFAKEIVTYHFKTMYESKDMKYWDTYSLKGQLEIREVGKF